MVSLSLLQQMKYVMIVKLEKMNDSISDQMTNTETLQYCGHDMFLSQTAVIFFFPICFSLHTEFGIFITRVRKSGLRVPIATPFVSLPPRRAPGKMGIGAPW